MIEHINQVVVDLSKVDNRTFIEVRKAGSKYDPETFQKHAYRVKGFQIDII